MKVTVCFGSVRVVVPCGDGDFFVRDLVREAIHRYRKATGKGSDSWVSVHNLQTQGGGILDLDDRLIDVVDDREHILASFEDGDGTHHHGGGDGASGSSVGTGSPDIFQDGDHKYPPPPYPSSRLLSSSTDIEVTGEQLASAVTNTHLQVRRGSEPALNQLPLVVGGAPPPPVDSNKRWSAAPIILEPAGATLSCGASSAPQMAPPPAYSAISPPGDCDLGGFRRRDGSSRLSMQFLGDGGGYRWAEAAERAAAHGGHGGGRMMGQSTSLPRESKRKEPLGQANCGSSPVPGLVNDAERAELIVIRNEPGPLGIHVVPDYDRFGKDRGLLVQGIEPGKRIDRDGRLAIYDRIIEINGENLLNVPFQRVQEIFKLYLNSPELRLKVVKNSALESLRKPPPPPVYPRFPEDKENVSMVECDQKQVTPNTKVATVSPTKKMPVITKNLKSLLAANTRKIGRKIEIDLVKGPHGLGFSITTRDNPAGGNCPIYIKNIIPKGAAIEDGRLKIGDRLLEVNGVEMTGKSQAEAVSVLRAALLGSTVKIVVSRQEEVVDNNTLPRIIDSEQETTECENSNDRPIDMNGNHPHTQQQQHDSNVVNSNSKHKYQQPQPPPPDIPPLPQGHLDALSQNKNTVAKIISQLQETVNNNGSFHGHNSSFHSNSSGSNNNMADDTVFPWKHREILTYNIPVHDTEKAGLGISVKGKTSGTQDLGIFIKNVINGGAASRDKRLRTNDQLLNVNGISLLQQTNHDAMETLRKAMLHTEGPVPGNITLTIARRAASPNRSFGDIASKSANGSDPNLLYSGGETSNSGSSTNTVIFNPNKEQETIGGGKQQLLMQEQMMNTWNPVLERLTGNRQQQQQMQLRNESYYRATHDTWTASMLNGQNLLGGTTMVSLAEPILIEDEYGTRMIQHGQNSRIKVHSNNKLNLSNGSIPENRNDHEPDGKATAVTSGPQLLLDNKSSDSLGMKSQTPTSITSTTTTTTNPAGTDPTYASQLSLENPQGFSRDAFGRQSMSEKRHATLDAKNTDTYQRSKKMREERKTNLVRVGSVESVVSVNRQSEHPEYADKLGQLGPSLGMKKSSSLESLQTMVQEIQMQDERDPAYSYRGPGNPLKVIRGRGCEQSFRNAVVVDPNHQSESGAKKHWLLDGPIDNEDGNVMAGPEGFSLARGAPRQSSLNAAFDSKNKKKKSNGIFKGIGSMFRFGKHRKVDLNSEHFQPIGEFETKQQQYEQLQPNFEHKPANFEHKPGNFEHSTSFEHKQSVEHKQNFDQIYQQRPNYVHRHAEQVQVIPENVAVAPSSVKYRPNASETNSRRFDRKVRHTYYNHQSEENPYGGRPGSRSGITEVPFTHYVNYNELQNHLRKDPLLSDSQIVQMRLQVQQQRLKVEEESRKQHQYHSQRQARPESSQLRPVSNFYEYESIQSMLNNRRIPPSTNQNHQGGAIYNGHQETSSLPRQHHPQQQQPVQGRHPNGRNPRGPFVTHVTIGDSSPHQQNGTKV